VDVAPDKFVNEIKAKSADILALSALLTTTMPMMKPTRSTLVKAGIHDRVKVLVGGAPVSQAYADQIGADGDAPDAGSACKLAKSFL
jgi:5-methyltetrahydrofolate--homocysteine methyltransferase